MEEDDAEDGWDWSFGRKNSGKKVQVCLQFSLNSQNEVEAFKKRLE